MAINQSGPISVTGFNIEAFRATIAQRGLLQTSKFQVFFPIPPGMQNRGASPAFTSTARGMNMRCEQAEIPGITWGTTPVRRFGYGPEEQVPTTPQFGPVMLTFMVDADATEWQFFREWQMLCMNFDNEKGVSYPTGNMGGIVTNPYETGYLEDYATNIAVSMFSNEGIERVRVILREAWPTLVSEIKLDWADQTSVAKFRVVFNMQDFYHDYSNPSVTLLSSTSVTTGTAPTPATPQTTTITA